MLPSEIAAGFWEAMRENDWPRAAEFLAPNAVVDWPCTGERFVGRDAFAAMQARYPSNTGRWTFDLHRLVVDGHSFVSEVTVSDGEQSARLIAIAEVVGDYVAHQVEYWPTGYDPEPWRKDLATPIDRVP